MSNKAIVLVSHTESKFGNLESGLRELLPDDVKVETWDPLNNDESLDYFRKMITEINPQLVVAFHPIDFFWKGEIYPLYFYDYHHIVSHICQSKLVPFYCLRHPKLDYQLPEKNSMFEIHAPQDSISPLNFIKGVYTGLSDIRNFVEKYENPEKILPRYSKILSDQLGENCQEFDIYPYITNFDKTELDIGYVLEKNNDVKCQFSFKKHFVSYVISHLLLNSILRFPGPIICKRYLCALVATNKDDYEKIKDFFEEDRYLGPFSTIENYFWLDKVRSRLMKHAKNIPDISYPSYGNLFRTVLESHLDIKLKKTDDCSRLDCKGLNGGYFCPFTKKTVCDREDCSVAYCSWLPSGASQCRVEKDFFKKYAPLFEA